MSMGSTVKNIKGSKSTAAKKSPAGIFIIGGVLIIILVSVLVKGLSGGGGSNDTSAGGDLLIKKSDISSTAKFYPYKAGSTKMEVLALKASDGSIRTAFNTCQVCYDSGRGYYEQEGDVLVCQNCGNRFSADQVELVKGGCNPVPILEENKTDDGTNITISGEFLTQNKELFGNWKR